MSAAPFNLESEIISEPRINQSREAKIAAWRELLVNVKTSTITTSELSRMMNMETPAAYRAAKAMARQGLISLIPPEKSGQPSTILINPKLKFFK